MSPVGDPESELTRKQRREQARAQRKASEEAETLQAARRTRLIQLGALSGVVVVIIVIILLATGGGTKKGASAPKSPAANQTVAAVTSLLQGIPQQGNALGNKSAPVTIQYFGDLECPVCKEFTLGALPTLIQKYVRTGELKIEYRSLETATRNPETFRTQQIAALAAGKQQRMWYYVELFYHEQGEENSEYVTERYLQELAEQVPGLSLTSWSAARNDSAYTTQITSDAQTAQQVGFTGTPSFLIGKATTAMQKLEYTSLTEPGAFEAAIAKLLKA